MHLLSTMERFLCVNGSVNKSLKNILKTKYSHTISFCANLHKDDFMTSKCSSDKQDDANFIQSTFGVELLQHSKPPFLNQDFF